MYKKSIALIAFIGVLFFFLFQQGWIGGNSSNIKEISVIDANKKLKNEDTVVLISNPTCDRCKKLMPKVQRVLNHVDKKIYYLNTDSARLESEKELREFLMQYSITELPTLMYYHNGDPFYIISGDLDVKTLKNYLDIK